MDIIGKETLEEMLKDYTGTVICVSHDRYFIKEVCDSLLCFENGGAAYYSFGYSQYEQQRRFVKEEMPKAEVKTEEKKVKEKSFSPLKELSKVTKQLAKKEESISLLEEEINSLKEQINDNASDYEKLVSLTEELQIKENELETYFFEWEELSAKKEDLESRCPKK
jgi:ATP-binding cassette subfamily F protein 3